MDLQFLSFPFFFSFLFFVFTVVKTVQRPKANNSNPKLPRGPWKLPLIGNMHQLAASLPHHSLRNLAQKHGPLMHLQLGEVSTIVVSSQEMAKEVMKIHEKIFAQRPHLLVVKMLTYEFKDIVFAPYGNYWRQLRKICKAELLSANCVLSFRSIREEEVSNLIKTISSHEGSPVNLKEKIFSLTYGITSRAAFGNKCKDKNAFSPVVTEFIKLVAGFCIADLYPSIKLLQLVSRINPKVKKICRESDKILGNIINDHKESREATKTCNEEAEEDLVDALLKLQEHGDLEFPLTDNCIKAVILDMFSRGSETSSTVVEWAFSEMLKNPKVMKKAQAEVRQVFESKGNVDETSIHELKYLKLVTKETMRLHPPAPLLLPRECSKNCEINGYDIPVNTRVIVNAWAIGRDPRYWTEAETFDPERFLNSSIDYKGADFEYIPFGAGRRICPGILFARPNIELPLAQLLYHFDWKLPSGMKHEDLDMTEAFGVSVRRKKDLVLVPIPYHPSSVKKDHIEKKNLIC